MYVLCGRHPRFGDYEHYFTDGEHDTAIAVAKAWLAKGWKPFLYDTDGRLWLTWRNGVKDRRAA